MSEQETVSVVVRDPEVVHLIKERQRAEYRKSLANTAAVMLREAAMAWRQRQAEADQGDE